MLPPWVDRDRRDCCPHFSFPQGFLTLRYDGRKVGRGSCQGRVPGVRYRAREAIHQDLYVIANGRYRNRAVLVRERPRRRSRNGRRTGDRGALVNLNQEGFFYFRAANYEYDLNVVIHVFRHTARAMVCACEGGRKRADRYRAVVVEFYRLLRVSVARARHVAKGVLDNFRAFRINYQLYHRANYVIGVLVDRDQGLKAVDGSARPRGMINRLNDYDQDGRDAGISNRVRGARHYVAFILVFQ